MASVVIKYIHALRVFGWRDTLRKMYSVGKVKFGDYKGQDAFGNKYYENKDYPLGQHRWVEYADIHNFDSSTVTAEWHPWLHHYSDHVPTPEKPLPDMKPLQIAQGVSTPAEYNHWIGPGRVVDRNRTGFRPRGAGLGNIYQEAGEPSMYYKQPGHPALPKDQGGRFLAQKGMSVWDPEDPEGKKQKRLIRDLEDV